MTDPADLGVRDAAASLRQRNLSSHELVDACLKRIRDRDGEHSHKGDPGSVNAWIRVYEEDARAALNEAVGRYEGMGARWDTRRAEGRLRPYGIRRGVRGRRAARPTSGWAALTPTEVKIAALVARGDSTADIARGMFLSRRTVQTYISHILTKLDASSRVDIVREALRHGVTP